MCQSMVRTSREVVWHVDLNQPYISDTNLESTGKAFANLDLATG